MDLSVSSSTGREATSTNGTPGAMSRTFAAPLNLAGEDTTGDITGYIDAWVYVVDKDELDPLAGVQISLDSTQGSYSYSVPRVGLMDGWNELHIPKADFSPTGAPSWAEIVGVTNTVRSAGVGYTADVTLDDLKLVANKRLLDTSQYDELSRLKIKTDAKGHETSYEYDASGNKTSQIDPKGPTEWEYDPMNRETTVTDARYKTTVKGYDSVGNLSWLRDANEATTTYRYDLAGRETTVTDPMGKSTRTEYDEAGNRTKVIDPSSVETTYSYDKLNRLKGVKDELDNITRYEYDAAGNQTRIIPPAPSGQTVSEYDEMGRLYRTTDGANATTTHEYDLAGRETTTTLPTSVVKTASYDNAGRLKQTGDGTTTLSYDYDMQGNTIKQSKSGGLTEWFAFDDTGEAVKTVDSSGRIKSRVVDADGMPTMERDINGRIDYVYDQVGSLDNMKVENETSSTFAYDDMGNEATYTQVNGVKTEYKYDDNSRLTSLETSKTGAQLFKYSYQYDDSGNIATETITGGGNNLFGYDNNNQLKSWTSTSGVETNWDYDASGNRGTQTVVGGLTSVYQYGGDNRLTTESVGGVVTSFDYDNSGNLWRQTTGADTTTFVFSSDNELVSISSSSTAAAFEYDAEGKRTSKTVNGTTTQFVYDGIKLLAEKDGSGNITARYFYDTDGKLVSMKRGGNSYYFHLNHRGDVVKVTDSSQTTVASYQYDPWGNIRSESGSFADEQPFRYASYYFDSEIGMYYVMARYYEPSIARFISKDEASDGGRQALDRNAYPYALNNPNRLKDPDGLWPLEFYWQSSEYSYKPYCRVHNEYDTFISKLSIHEIAYRYSGTRVHLSDYYNTMKTCAAFQLWRSVAIKTTKRRYFGSYSRAGINPIGWRSENSLDTNPVNSVWVDKEKGRPKYFYLILDPSCTHPQGGRAHIQRKIRFTALWTG